MSPARIYLLLTGVSAGCYALAFTLSMVYQVQVVGLSPLQLVLVGTVLEASVFLGEVPTGIVADVYSRRLSVLIGLFRAGVSLARRRPVVRTMMLVSFVSGLASEAFDRLWIVHLLDIGLPGPIGEVVWFTAIGLAGTLVALLVSLAVNRLFRKTLTGLHPARLMAALALIEVAAVAAFALSGHFWLALALLWIRSSGHVVAEPVGTAWMNHNTDSGVRALRRPPPYL